MFESVVSNIKRRLSKSSEKQVVLSEIPEKTSFKKNFNLWKSKLLLKSEPKLSVTPVDIYKDTALSPRAAGAVVCAQTEIEWPKITDNNPNILDKFTRIVSVSYDAYPSTSKVSVVLTQSFIDQQMTSAIS